MRKLTVKNFSVIKDAESTPLEFGKITVLIGPQSSGKSLLCKLAYFFGLEMISQAAGWSVATAPSKISSDTFANRFFQGHSQQVDGAVNLLRLNIRKKDTRQK